MRKIIILLSRNVRMHVIQFVNIARLHFPHGTLFRDETSKFYNFKMLFRAVENVDSCCIILFRLESTPSWLIFEATWRPKSIYSLVLILSSQTRGNFVFDQSAHLFTFWPLSQSERVDLY